MFWAKKDGDDWHDLTAHLLDVGAVCECLLQDRRVSAKIRERLGTAAIPDRVQLLSALLALHDIGKLAPGFQARMPGSKARLAALGFPFPSGAIRKYRHDHGTTVSLRYAFDESTDTILPADRIRIARLLGGHHGMLPPRSVRKLRDNDAFGLDRIWWDARYSMIHTVFSVLAAGESSRDITLHPPADVLFLGLTTVADWIGSAAADFPFHSAEVRDRKAYLQTARERARKALDTHGWVPVSWTDETVTPAQLIDAEVGSAPVVLRPVQQLAQQVSERLQRPFLVVVEAATGGGKTEASWILQDHAARRLGQVGTYIAMPTTATSDQMHKRFNGYLKRRSIANTGTQLIHGRAAFKRLRDAPDPQDVGRDTEGTGNGFRSEAQEDAGQWFRTAKRALLAPFGVGTVDQALMSVFPVRHGYLRLFGLAGKVVIFDEVHAYDQYMFALFEGLLHWLRTLGSSVIVLSATLPREQTRRLLAAWDEDPGEHELDVESDAPPFALPDEPWADKRGRTRISARLDDGTVLTSVGDAPDIREPIQTDWRDEGEPLIAAVADAVESGAQVAWICNTVADAQRRDDVFRSRFPDSKPDLLHARYTLADRQRHEEHVLERYGKSRPDDQGHLLISTQIVEQSLDLDFDLMVSDLAPIDLLIQRVGRLWRHEPRRRVVSQPTLVLIRPELDPDTGIPAFGVHEHVYDRHILLRTWYTLRAYGATLTLPDHTRHLIESVYADHALELPSEEARRDLQHAAQQHDEERKRAESLAEGSMIPRPASWLDTDQPAQIENDDDPEVHRDVRAATRLGSLPVNVILLNENANGQLTTLDGEHAFDATQPLNPGQVVTLAEQAVAVATEGRWAPVARALLSEESPWRLPVRWREHRLLRYHRYLVLDDEGRGEVGGRSIKYSDSLGLSQL